MKSKQHLRRILCAVMLISVLSACTVSCGSGGAQETAAVMDTGEPQTDGTLSVPQVSAAAAQTVLLNKSEETGAVDTGLTVSRAPTADRSGLSVRILCSESPETDPFDRDGEPQTMPSGVRERREAVEKRLGVVLTPIRVSSVYDRLSAQILSNDVPDIVWAGGDDASRLMLNGLLTPLSPLSDEGKAAVSVAALRDLSVYGRQYLLTGAANPGSVKSVTAVLCDSAALARAGYTAEDMKTLALSGTWTLDRMQILLREVGTGLDISSDGAYGMWKGCDALSVRKDTDDAPVVSVYSAANVYSFGAVSALTSGYSAGGEAPLFRVGTIGALTSSADTRTDAFLLPVPALNEGSGYISHAVFSECDFCAIPAYCGEPKLSSDVLDVLYAVSLGTVYPAILNETFARTKDTVSPGGIADLILRSRSFDFLEMYGIGQALKSAFDTSADAASFDDLLFRRSVFVSEALAIAIGQTVGG